MKIYIKKFKINLGTIVRVAITDYKLPLTEDPTQQVRGVMPFIVDERAVKIGFPKSRNAVKTFWDNNDYYPFGMLIPERSWSSQDYRYGYNGKENDNEIKGTGNSIDYGVRIYDPRIGRFLSLDPLKKKFPYLTPYNFASNSPISAKDDGNKGEVTVHVFVFEVYKTTNTTFVVKNDVKNDYEYLGAPDAYSRKDQFEYDGKLYNSLFDLPGLAGDYFKKAHQEELDNAFFYTMLPIYAGATTLPLVFGAGPAAVGIAGYQISNLGFSAYQRVENLGKEQAQKEPTSLIPYVGRQIDKELGNKSDIGENTGSVISSIIDFALSGATLAEKKLPAALKGLDLLSFGLGNVSGNSTTSDSKSTSAPSSKETKSPRSKLLPVKEIKNTLPGTNIVISPSSSSGQ